MQGGWGNSTVYFYAFLVRNTRGQVQNTRENTRGKHKGTGSLCHKNTVNILLTVNVRPLDTLLIHGFTG